MKKIGILILVSLSFFSFDLSKSAQKKMNKTITALWEGKVIEKIPIELTAKQRTSFNVNTNELFQLKSEKQLVGYLYLSKAASRSDVIDYMVIFSPDLKILKVQVLVYREDYGGEVGSKRWLKQFIGKSNGEAMKFGHDIQNISGATISARSMTQGVSQVSKNIKTLKSQAAL